ncbi:unnamed protein product [Clonostachys rosea]|uniref:Mtf2-like C-terminal domain-containing protein n=1 Tax=Bionectria ochroleuca TaxID=29856 RepID=A0ABY6U2N2_BIOOC|nr:unnamed protein product [Clonostachys rosea]
MSSTFTPFLYQTRTLQRALTNSARIASRSYASKRHLRSSNDASIPFDWTNIPPPEEDRPLGSSGHLGGSEKDEKPSTITPSEAHIFKKIFDEIAQGKMPRARAKRPTPSTEYASPKEDLEGLEVSSADANSRSIVVQARMADFRERVLSRFPQSLREAAQLALGLFELKDGAEVIETETTEQKEERSRFEQLRKEEKSRVYALMKACNTDAELWKVMEKEVFSLPEELGIATLVVKKQPTRRGRKSSKATAPVEEPAAVESAAAENETGGGRKHIMDIDGPLYSQYLNHGLNLLDTSFAKPSPFALQILPRVRSLGLPSYVLGVSTRFYTILATIHWNRFGDASSALDVVQEMMATGLTADDDVKALLVSIRDHVLGCTWGVQGPFVSGMMEAPPYDGALMQRIQELYDLAEDSIKQTEGYSG